MVLQGSACAAKVDLEKKAMITDGSASSPWRMCRAAGGRGGLLRQFGVCIYGTCTLTKNSMRRVFMMW
jgi:hypothetical protein